MISSVPSNFVNPRPTLSALRLPDLEMQSVYTCVRRLVQCWKLNTNIQLDAIIPLGPLVCLGTKAYLKSGQFVSARGLVSTQIQQRERSNLAPSPIHAMAQGVRRSYSDEIFVTWFIRWTALTYYFEFLMYMHVCCERRKLIRWM